MDKNKHSWCLKTVFKSTSNFKTNFTGFYCNVKGEIGVCTYAIYVLSKLFGMYGFKKDFLQVKTYIFCFTQLN